MNLLDLLKTEGSKYLRDAMPGGRLNPEVSGQGLLDTLALGTAPVPVVGDVVGGVADVNRMVQNPEERTAANIGLAGLGLIPFMPSLSTVRSASNLMPQQEALDLAQKRAALPIEQGGLGLPKNNTPMDRAKAMGFDVEAFHGSGSPNIEAFDPSLVGAKTSNAFDNYLWATSSPQSASGYALNPSQFQELPEVRQITEQINDLSRQAADAFGQKDMQKFGKLRKDLSDLTGKKSKLYEDFQSGKFVSEGSTVYPLLLRGEEFMPYEAGSQNWMRVNRPAIDESKARGFQGVAIKNVKDNPNAQISGVANTYATPNPDLMRSRFAAFDPWRKTAATAAAFGVAAPNLLAAEQRQQQSQPVMPPTDPLTEELIRSSLMSSIGR